MEEKKNLQTRPPIVVVLGHVDHGKTTLLDKIRQTNLQSREAGGITQSIGASQIRTREGKKITFIDTPGHAAFTNLRMRGAKVADIAILVVAADDGCKPQTVEALDDIKSAKIPFIVALSKIDLASANVEKVAAQLENLGVIFEKKGGEVPWVKVSGKTGEGLDELLETIILVSEMHETTASPAEPLDGVIIETTKGKAGPLASVVVRNGRLGLGDNLAAGEVSGKVKSLTDFQGTRISQANPGDAVQILGFSDIPPVGAMVQTKVSLEKSPAGYNPEAPTGQIPIVLKTDTSGSLEAIVSSLPRNIVVVESGVGEVGESNVLTAKSAKARIITFNLKTGNNIAKFADSEGVKIESFDIIYKLLDRVEEIIKGDKAGTSGRVQIIAVFPFNNQRVAGCKVLEGVVNKTDKLTLTHDLKSLGQVKIISMKRQKLDISQAKVGDEFGIIFEPQLDFEIGDMLLSVHR